MRHRVIISYGWSAALAADRLRGWLGAYRTPKALVGEPGHWGPIPARLGPIYRLCYEAAEDAAQIEEALAQSEALVLLGSAGSADSPSSNHAVVTFRKLGKADRVFPVLANRLPGQEAEDLLPPAVLGQNIPTIDLGELAKPGARLSYLELVARILGVEPHTLMRHEVSKRNAVIGAALGACAACLVTAASAGLFALAFQHGAEASRQEAQRLEDELERERIESAATLQELAVARKTIEAKSAERSQVEGRLQAVMDEVEAENKELHAQTGRLLGAIEREPDQPARMLMGAFESTYTRLALAPRPAAPADQAAATLEAVARTYARLGVQDRSVRAYSNLVVRARRAADAAPEDATLKLALAGRLRQLAIQQQAGQAFEAEGQSLIEAARLYQTACPQAASETAAQAVVAPSPVAPSPAASADIAPCIAFAETVLQARAAREKAGRPLRAELIEQAAAALEAAAAKPGVDRRDKARITVLQRDLQLALEGG